MLGAIQVLYHYPNGITTSTLIGVNQKRFHRAANITHIITGGVVLAYQLREMSILA
nr:MAG TPA: hypothetical protein [Bacteriophage sp.]